MKEIFYQINGKSYPVKINYKRIKNVYLRYKDGTFYISCSCLTFKNTIFGLLDKYASRLVKKDLSRKQIQDGKIYLFGECFIDNDEGIITLSSGESFTYSSKEERSKKIEKLFLEYILESASKYALEMHTSFKKISAKHVKTRYGSYSKKTGNIYISYTLIPYRKEIIDSVIVHELAHTKVFNHSKDFYEVVYRYCPKYKIYTKMLKRGEF